MSGKTAAIPPEGKWHVIEGAEPNQFKIRMLCGLIADYSEVRLREMTPKRKQCICKSCFKLMTNAERLSLDEQGRQNA